MQPQLFQQWFCLIITALSMTTVTKIPTCRCTQVWQRYYAPSSKKLASVGIRQADSLCDTLPEPRKIKPILLLTKEAKHQTSGDRQTSRPAPSTEMSQAQIQ